MDLLLDLLLIPSPHGAMWYWQSVCRKLAPSSFPINQCLGYTLASNNEIEARSLAAGRHGVEVIDLDVSRAAELSEAVSAADVVVR